MPPPRRKLRFCDYLSIIHIITRLLLYPTNYSICGDPPRAYMSPGRSAVAQKIFFATASTLSHNKCICIFVKREKTSEKATLFKLVLKMSKSAVFSLVHLEGLEPSIIDPKGRPENAKSSTFHIIFYHKISYQKSLNPFIYRHFDYLTLSNNTI